MKPHRYVGATAVDSTREGMVAARASVMDRQICIVFGGELFPFRIYARFYKVLTSRGSKVGRIGVPAA